MQKMRWNENYATGIEIIDYQHRKIFASVNALWVAIENIKDKEKILELIKSLDFYTSDHFDTEEKYMIKFNYIEYPSHKKAHEYFKEVYEEIRENYIYQKSETIYILALHLNDTLAEWLKYHITTEDHMLAEFLKNKISK